MLKTIDRINNPKQGCDTEPLLELWPKALSFELSPEEEEGLSSEKDSAFVSI